MSDDDADMMMSDWLDMVRKKNDLAREESELTYRLHCVPILITFVPLTIIFCFFFRIRKLSISVAVITNTLYSVWLTTANALLIYQLKTIGFYYQQRRNDVVLFSADCVCRKSFLFFRFD